MLHMGNRKEGGVLMQGQLENPEVDNARRRAGRRKLFLVASAGQTKTTCSVDVLNISASGMLIRTSGALDLDEGLTLVLPEVGEREATIVWVAEDLYGCRFASSLSLGEVSAVLLKAAPLTNMVESTSLEEESGFGETLRKLRQESGQSMEEFAAHLGVTKPTLWKWETGRVRPRAKALARISELLGMTEQDLLFGKARKGKVMKMRQDGPGKEELVDTIARCREEIAAGAGVTSEKVTIGVNWA
jgi:transcriptional regulator with XRE-family HTH domain